MLCVVDVEHGTPAGRFDQQKEDGLCVLFPYLRLAVCEDSTTACCLKYATSLLRIYSLFDDVYMAIGVNIQYGLRTFPRYSVVPEVFPPS